MTITPFWNRIPKFFLYGLHPPVLILGAIVFVASLLFGGLILNIVFYIVAVKYAAEALQHTTNGELTPPKLTFEIINENYQLPFKLFVVFFCYFFFIGFLMELGNWLIAIPVYILGQLLIPAVTISLVVTEEIGYSLNPLNWFNIALRIGWPYLLMVLFLFLFNLVDYQFSSMVMSRTSSAALLAPLSLVLNLYFLVIAFHLMGYVVLQYHEELGYGTPVAMQEAESSANTALSSPLLEKFIEEENFPAAAAEFGSLIEQAPQDMELRRRMYIFLRSHGQHDILKRYAPGYFTKLCEMGRFSDAANVFLESQERGDAFSPQNPAHYLPVLHELRRRRANKQAVTLVQGFHKRFPDDPNTPELYLELAKVLSEELQRDDLAQQALRFVLNSFSGHDMAPQVKQYLEVITALHASPAQGN